MRGPGQRRQFKTLLRTLPCASTLVLWIAAAAAAAPTPPLEIRTLSSRPDLVSGGDALIEVRAPAGSPLGELRLDLNGQDVTGALAAAEDGVFRGVVRGMKLGKNALEARLGGTRAAKARLVLENYPLTGPILSGKHLTPYECRTVESGLGEPLDADCSAARKIEYFYRASDKTFKPLPPGERPADLVETTTNAGATVPYIVRVDSGTINRTIYRIAILDEPKVDELKPDAPAEPWKPGAAWNGKLAVSFGGGAGTQYNQGTNQAADVLSDLYLSRGFAHLIATELVNQLHGNAVLQGEALMMLKEYFIENYGVPRWTVGSGGSGGAIQQLLITEIYPGLLDGLQPSLAFPDSTLHTADCGLLQNFWRSADPNVWTDAKRTAVEGYTKGTCGAWERSFVPISTATNARGCALTDSSRVYDPVKNPKGVRCTIQEMRANVYGRDAKTGFARKPQDNVGLQYGLGALRSGAIGIDEFLELNEKIGGNDIDGAFVAQRTVADPIALRAVYASGLMNSGGGGLASVPILHVRGYTDPAGDIHDRERDFTIRARLQRANGRSDNQVIWIGTPAALGRRPGQGQGAQAVAQAATAPVGAQAPAPQAAAPAPESPSPLNLSALALETMNEWLDAIAADPAPASADKVVKYKPAKAVDTCWNAEGESIAEAARFEGSGQCNAVFPVHSEPRLIAGAPLTNDVIKCQLRPIDYADYGGGTRFTPKQRARLQKIFPQGVCDFSKPGEGQVPLKGTYQRY